MLFDGALRSLERALPGFECADPLDRNTIIHNNLQHATEIIRELNSSLNMEAGGQLSDTLRGLYCYFEDRLREANLRKTRAEVEEVILHLRELRDAWATMLAGQGQEAPADLRAA